MTQGVQEKIGTLAAVETEAHFVQVGWKMLGADFVPRSDDAALEQGESRLHRVRVNVGPKPHILFSAVVNGFVPVGQLSESAGIGGKFIGNNRNRLRQHYAFVK